MEVDDAAVEFLRGAGAGAVHHHAGSLLDHLVATSRLLAFWGCSPPVCTAGLFHSFYSWLAQPTPKSRAALVAAIGSEAEELVYVFNGTDPDDLLASDVLGDCVSVRTGSGIATLPPQTYANVLWLDLANTEDLLARASLSPAQRRRLQERCASVKGLLAKIDAMRQGDCDGARA